jgi:hypothetical protein
VLIEHMLILTAAPDHPPAQGYDGSFRLSLHGESQIRRVR